MQPMCGRCLGAGVLSSEFWRQQRVELKRMTLANLIDVALAIQEMLSQLEHEISLREQFVSRPRASSAAEQLGLPRRRRRAADDEEA